MVLNNPGLKIPMVTKKRLIDYCKKDKQFATLAKQVSGHTLIHKERLFLLYQFANLSASLEGNVAELGVYKGGSAKLLAKVFEKGAKEKVVHLFDTFCGIPETNPLIDLHKKGDFATTSLDSAQQFLSDCHNVVFHKGLFSATFNRVANETFCFVHIDCDVYQSVLECCEFFYPRMTCGGIMLFDDYGFLSCPGAKKAVDEYFQDKSERPVYLTTGQCIVTKSFTFKKTKLYKNNMIIQQIGESIKLKQALAMQADLLSQIAEQIVQAFRKHKKVLIFGNGGSAADAQHIACELSGKFYLDREPLPAIALTTNTSLLTAIANDYSIETIFSRQVKSLANRGDVVIGLSTSGNSTNVIIGIEEAKRIGAITVVSPDREGSLKNLPISYYQCLLRTHLVYKKHILLPGT